MYVRVITIIRSVLSVFLFVSVGISGAQECYSVLDQQSLFDAVRNGEAVRVASLVGACADVNRQERLWCSASPGDGPIAMRFIPQQEDDPHDEQKEGRAGAWFETVMTPVGCAAYKNNRPVTNILLSAKNLTKQTVQRAIMIAAHHGCSEPLDALCERYVHGWSLFSNKNNLLQQLQAPLCEAVSRGHAQTVKVFLSRGVPLFRSEKVEHSVFHIAAENGDHVLLKQLLDCEQERTLADQPENRSWYQSVLVLCASLSAPSKISLLSQGVAGINQRGQTAADCARNKLEHEHNPEMRKKLQACIDLLGSHGQKH